MGLLKKSAGSILDIFPCSRTMSTLRDEPSPFGMNQTMRGLAGSTFLNQSKPLRGNTTPSIFVLEYLNFSTLP